MKSETIAAIATALSESGISIIRISGNDAFQIADRIYRSPGNKKRLLDFKSHMMYYGFIYDGDVLIDEVMAVIMKSPKSYTAEDTVEIQCHGGVLVTKKILESILKAGARLAEPGEFTKRAFLNGRIDLSGAEAVMDVIRSENEWALKSSVGQLRGSLSEEVHKLRESLLYEIAYIESALDDPEHISLEGYPQQLAEKLVVIQKILCKLLKDADQGRVIREGINTVIVGKPNAGKSSLLNRLAGEERAIVTDIAGTTRDILQETVRISGISLNISDTAGIRFTKDEVEKIGVERARKSVENADLILYVVDSSVPMDENDDEIIQMIMEKKCIIIWNKSDLPAVVTEDFLLHKLEKYPVKPYFIRISAKENKGMELLEKSISDLFFEGMIDYHGEILITNTRHKEAVQDTLSGLEMVLKSIENDMPEDFLSIDLMSAYAALGRITGEEVGDDLIREIFSKFCMGK